MRKFLLVISTMTILSGAAALSMRGAAVSQSAIAADQEAVAAPAASADSVSNIAAKDSVYVKVDQMAEFPGGMNGMMNFLAKTIHYPAEAQINNVQGRVIMKFIINEDGTISDAEVVKGVDPYLDAEALRVVNLMPAWKPGMNGGVPVKSYFVLPVTFKLNEVDLSKKKKEKDKD